MDTTDALPGSTMTRIFHVNGKPVDVTDAAAVQALTPDEYADLLTQTLNDTDANDTEIIGLRQDQPPTGTGFIIMNPPTEEAEHA